MTRTRLGLALATLIVIAPVAHSAEIAPEVPAQSILGGDTKGANWTVAPTVRSDGFVRLFALETPYGDFQVNGQRRMSERLQELRALKSLEEMSNTDVFANAVAKAGLAPIRFGRDLVLDPVETTGNLVSGIGNMFDRAVSEVEHAGESRDSFVESVVGIKKAMRDLAFELRVDPYTDFTPLRDGLEDVARVMAAGDISVSAAISAIPGGAGVAVSATSSASGLSNPIRDKSSAEIVALVSSRLKALEVPDATTEVFVKNAHYSPGDQFAIAEALTTLKADNSAAFVLRAAQADGADVAKFQRYRAELLAKHSARLGTLKEFYVVAEFALNRDANGGLVAAFPFDGLSWTDTVAKSMTALSQELATRGETKSPLFATTGKVSSSAQAELKKRGWKLMTLD
ncbi:MAG: hypothetical protein K8S25_13230 [Alphaproteobacteria bacterium]|nr:hypothetical protein [Alphaproteobacteria bacterium]